MKKTLLTIILSILTMICSGQQHRALLIGIADYPSNSGFGKIHADNDVRLLSQLLTEYKVKTLINEQATFSNIEKELTNLERLTQKGDTIIISFSCHGQQMITDDPKEPDSLDEAIIPYDACSKQTSEYDGEKHLKDDVLSNFVDKIRKKTGEKGFVLVLLDACHSGDSFKDAKDNKNYRGGYPVFGDERRHSVEKSLNNIVRIKKDKGLSDVLYIGACQSCQLNRETQPKQNGNWYGSLSYAFYEAFTRLNKFNNIDILCNEIKDNIEEYNRATGQTPEFAASFNLKIINNIENPTPPTEPREDNCDKYLQGIIISIIFITLFLIAIILWKKR